MINIRKVLLALSLSLLLCFCLEPLLPISTYISQSAQAAQKVKLNKSKITLYTGKTYKLKMSGTKSKVTWKSSDKSVAKVDKNGKVTAKKVGKATITATVNKKKYKCKVTVKSTIFVYETKVSMVTGGEDVIVVDFNTTGSFNNISFSSSDENVVTCKWADKDEGWINLTAKNSGTATIKIKNKKTNDVVKTKVTVTEAEPTVAPIPLSVDKTSLSINSGETTTVNITYYGTNSIVYSIDDKNIVSCEWSRKWDGNTTNLNITGKWGGAATVTVYDKSTGDKTDISVIVIGPTPTPEPTPTPTPSPTPTPTPSPTPEPTYIVNLPETPLTVINYNYNGTIKSQYTITDIYASIIPYDYSNYSNDKKIFTVLFAGTNVYDYEGASSSRSPYNGWKLYNSDGAVVYSGTAYGPQIAMGESWLRTNCKSQKTGFMDPGEYSLKVVDVK